MICAVLRLSDMDPGLNKPCSSRPVSVIRRPAARRYAGKADLLSFSIIATATSLDRIAESHKTRTIRMAVKQSNHFMIESCRVLRGGIAEQKGAQF
jgi:hypothetical protein